jgi:transposase
MLGRRSPQATIFDGDRIYLDHVGRNTFYAFLAREGHDLFKDEDFGQLYHRRLGRPSVPPSQLCVALVLQYYDGCSDQEASDRAAYDQRWKVALGTEEMERPFVKSTLQLFRAQLLVHEKAKALFEASLKLARRKGQLGRDGRVRLALDTSNILGRGAVMDTYNLISEGIRLLVRALARAKGQKPEEYASNQGLGRHLGSSIKGESQVDWDDEGARSAFLAGLVADARRAMELAGRVCQGLEKESAAVRRIEAVSQVLAAILLQDVEVKQEAEGGEGEPVEQVKIKHNPSGQRICSVGDPEMRHGRKSASKRFDGHKLSLGVDVESQLIAGVEVLAGSAADDEGSLELAQASAEALDAELNEVEVLADCAYGDGANRERFRQAEVELKAKVPALGGSGEYFKKTDFVIDLEAMTCTCRAGRRPMCCARWARTRDARGRASCSTAGSAPRAHCGRTASNRANLVADVWPCTPKRRCCGRRGSGSGAPTSTASASSGRRSSTGLHGWCSWASGRRATAVAARPSSRP